MRAEPLEQTDEHPRRDVQQALQIITLAQRTGEEHVNNALRQANQIQADARATAEQVVRDAQAQADAVRREADNVLYDAQARAAEMAKDAQASADGLTRQAQLRYEEMVGNLAAKREALQQQIEALQVFDREYRARLVTFMQAQLRALWVEEPHVDVETEQPGAVAAVRLLPARQPDLGATTGSRPPQTSPSDDA